MDSKKKKSLNISKNTFNQIVKGDRHWLIVEHLLYKKGDYITLECLENGNYINVEVLSVSSDNKLSKECAILEIKVHFERGAKIEAV